MHVLAPGASMDSSADLYGQLRHSGCSIRDTLITPLHKSQLVSKPHLKYSQPDFTGCERFSILWGQGRERWGHPTPRLGVAAPKNPATFLASHSLQKIETERRREGR